MIETTTYTAMIDGGAGGETTIEAETIHEAWSEAVEWARGGSWGGDDVREDVYARLHVEEDGDGWTTERTEDVLVHEARDTECDEHEDGEHDWQAPHELVGGIEESPGVWQQGGLRMSYRCVCSRCGEYRTEETDDLQVPPLRRYTYEAADDRSLEWAAEQGLRIEKRGKIG